MVMRARWAILASTAVRFPRPSRPAARPPSARSHAAAPHCIAQLFHKRFSNPKLLTLRLHTDRIKHRDRKLVPKLAAQDLGNREPAQRTAPYCANLDVVIRSGLGGGKTPFEKA